MKAVFYTDRGKVRQHNEDSGGIMKSKDGALLAVVADGMGGHRAGDVASSMTVTHLESSWTEVEAHSKNPEEMETWMKDCVGKINQSIHEHASNHEECRGMGTTLVLAACTNDFLTIGNIGDSRCYILNENGFNQLTEDHSLVNELVRSGEISKEDAEHHPRKNVLLRALGTEVSVEVDVKTIGWEEGDMIILCSDGLTNKLTDAEIKRILETDEDLEKVGNRLISSANEAGGEDNISVAILHLFTSEIESG